MKRAHPLSLRLLICAPMVLSGVIMRFIGLEFKESSPDNVVAKFCPDKIPEIRRVVVPLFPTFKVEAGAVRRADLSRVPGYWMVFFDLNTHFTETVNRGKTVGSFQKMSDLCGSKRNGT